ncbi:MAG: cholesterol oxidase [Frankiales bacterium]|nr:cholesterol oxidase [Frankiales bacterium]
MVNDTHFDVLVIGSGFGGSVTALRLTEKGYRVGVLEAGRRFADADHAKTSWKLKDFVWAPRLGLTGVQRVHVLPDIVVLAGAGVGGGSLNYANTLYEPKSAHFYEDRQWGHITDWKDELHPYYEQAKRMLGVVPQPSTTPADVVLQKVAERMGVADSFGPTQVGVFFGRDGAKEPGVTVADPYFGGAGPARTGCRECGECMTGCRHGAKNTLVKNYLYLAEKAGAVVVPERTVTEVRERPGGGYAVTTVRSTAWARKPTMRTYTADQVVVSAGTWGTQQLLHRMKAGGQLRRISDRLGHLTRTNSESLGGAIARRSNPEPLDFTRGVAITSSIHPDEHTHVEPCRYGKGSNAMGLLTTLATTPRPGQKRWMTWLGEIAKQPGTLAGLYRDLNRWSERGIITLVMQSSDNSLTLRTKKGLLGRTKVTSGQGHGDPNPTWIEHADTAQRLIAEEIDGVPVNSLGEIVDIPMTAHFLGGCAIGDSPETGVVDPYQRVYGHPGLHVVDGSTISANLGVNPSLTITAQAERAMALWPNKGDADPRPALGSSYERVAPVRPVRPVVPTDAPGALHLPIVEVRHSAPAETAAAVAEALGV